MNRARLEEPLGHLALGSRNFDSPLQMSAQIRLDYFRSQIDQENLPEPSVEMLCHPGIGQMSFPRSHGGLGKGLRKPTDHCANVSFSRCDLLKLPGIPSPRYPIEMRGPAASAAPRGRSGAEAQR